MITIFRVKAKSITRNKMQTRKTYTKMTSWFAVAVLTLLGTEALAQDPSTPTLNSSSTEDVKKEKKRAKPAVNIRGTETFIAEYVGDNGNANEGTYGDDDKYATFRNLLYIQASNAVFDSSIRLDATLFAMPPADIKSADFVSGGQGYTLLNYENDYRVERIHGTIRLGKKLKVTAGDSYVSFGRGMALSLIKLDDVGVDNSLRGARVEYRVPRKWKATFVGGVVNSLNIDPLTHQVQPDDPLDRIVGARIEAEVMDALSLSAHGVFVQPRFDGLGQVDPARLYVDQSPGVGVLTGGAGAEVHFGGLHIYLEGNGQKHDNYRPATPVLDETGAAAFGEISYDLTPFNIKLEGIYYYRWLMEGPLRGSANTIGLTQPLTYNHMVTLEPIWMIIKSFGNSWGGRLTGDLYLKKSDTQLALSTALLKYEGGLMPNGAWIDHPPTAIVHPIVEIRQNFGETGISLAMEGGFRYESTNKPVEDEPDNGHLWHVLADLSLPIKGPHSMEIKSELRRHALGVTEGENSYWVTLTSLGYEMAGTWGVTAVHEYSDQTEGSLGKIGNWELPIPRQHYVWLMGTIHPPIDGLTIRLFGGSQRGGVKCAGGICRNYPDAVGGRFEAVYRF